MTTKSKKEHEINFSEFASINIGNNWSIKDFISLFLSFEFLYYYYFALKHIYTLMPQNKSMLQYLSKDILFWLHRKQSYSANPLNDPWEFYDLGHGLFNMNLHMKIKEIKYSSPGNIDIFGVAGIFKEIKEIVFKYKPNKKEKIEIDILNLEKLQLEIKILKELGFNENEIRNLFVKRDNSLQLLIDFKEVEKIKEIKIEEQSNKSEDRKF